jgi:ribosomal protein S18 acetylase RimI-like enzyme
MCLEAVTDNRQIEIVEALADEIWHEHFTAIIGREQVAYMLEKFQSKHAIAEQIRDGFQYFIIRNHNMYAGYFAVQLKGSRLFLSKFYILSAHRGKGLGRRAMAFIEKLAIEKTASMITLTVNRYNSAAIEVYKKLGFVIEESIVQDIGEGFVMDDYRMVKAVM